MWNPSRRSAGSARSCLRGLCSRPGRRHKVRAALDDLPLRTSAPVHRPTCHPGDRRKCWPLFEQSGACSGSLRSTRVRPVLRVSTSLVDTDLGESRRRGTEVRRRRRGIASPKAIPWRNPEPHRPVLHRSGCRCEQQPRPECEGLRFRTTRSSGRTGSSTWRAAPHEVRGCERSRRQPMSHAVSTRDAVAVARCSKAVACGNLRKRADATSRRPAPSFLSPHHQGSWRA